MERSNIDVFPQADSLERIFKIINIAEPLDLLNEGNMGIILGDITGRQVRYYIHASQFLGILDKQKKFTSFGEQLRKCNLFEQRILVVQKIMTHPVFSEVYFTELILGVKLDKSEVASIMRKHINLSSDVMYNRRAQTVMSWISWVNTNDELHTN